MLSKMQTLSGKEIKQCVLRNPADGLRGICKVSFEPLDSLKLVQCSHNTSWSSGC